MAQLRVIIIGGDQFRELAKAMKAAGDTGLKKNFDRRLRAAAKPVLRDLKAAIVATPIEGVPGMKRVGGQMVLTRKRSGFRRAKSTGLRRKIAAGIRLQIRSAGKLAGVRFVATSSRLDHGQRNLPALIDNPKGWRHPLFGDEGRWYQQRGRPWWWTTIKPHMTVVRREMTAALDDTAAEIARKAQP